jgi:Ca2+-transporting ATPase
MRNSLATSGWKRGLSEAEAQARLKAEGYNELPRPDRRTPLKIILEVLREPMIALLIAGGVVYLALGDWHEAVILLVFANLSIVITVIQETRTERVLEALRDLTSPRALVIRGGERKRIPGREVARGDVVVLAEGDRAPADATLIECDDLLVDESLLTGESVPVRKIVSPDLDPKGFARPGGDDSPLVFSASLVVRGSGTAEVTATGPQSEIGKIGQSLSSLDTEPPRLQTQMNRLVRAFGLVGAGVTILAVALYGVTRGHWLKALLGGIALGMSMLPEEFPVVLAVFMAMGAWRISRARVLTRRAAAIETLGSATVLCTDKTGTLTENRMTIRELRRADDSAFRLDRSADAAIPEAFRDLIHVGFLASARQPFDPMERAFHELQRKNAAQTAQPDADAAFVRAYGLRPDLLAVTQVWKSAASGPKLVVASKGAPETIAELCGLERERLEALKRSVKEMADDGLRVLGVARAAFHGAELPASPRDFAFEGRRRDRGDDGRRRQRRAVAQGRSHRRCDGRKGHGRRPRSLRDRPPGRGLRLDRQGRAARAANLRQFALRADGPTQWLPARSPIAIKTAAKRSRVRFMSRHAAKARAASSNTIRQRLTNAPRPEVGLMRRPITNSRRLSSDRFFLVWGLSVSSAKPGAAAKGTPARATATRRRRTIFMDETS